MSKWFMIGAAFVFIAFMLIGAELSLRTILGDVFLGFAFGCAFLDGVHHERKEANR